MLFPSPSRSFTLHFKVYTLFDPDIVANDLSELVLIALQAGSPSVLLVQARIHQAHSPRHGLTSSGNVEGVQLFPQGSIKNLH